MNTDTRRIIIVNKETTECQIGKLLGVTIDKHINMAEQIQKIYKQPLRSANSIQLLSYCLDFLPTEI